MIPSDELVEKLADPKSGLTVTPLIDAASQIGEGSIDIRLGPDIIVSPRATGATVFDPTDPSTFKRNLEQRQEYVRRGIGDPFQLQPGEFVIGRSLEYVTLPADVSAEALGRSSWGRLGLVIATATLELANVGDTPIMLTVGLSIAQLVFQRTVSDAGGRGLRRSLGGFGRAEQSGLDRPQRKRVQEWRRRHENRSRKRGRYKFQIKPALSRLHEDTDLSWVTPMAIKYVLGVVGERYAGKSTMVDYLTTHRHFRFYRLTQFIHEEALQRGLDVEDNRILRQVGNEMRERDGPAILAQLAFRRIRSDLLDSDGNKRALPVVIEGFRLPEEIEVWKPIEAFRPALVSARTRVRRERAIDGQWVSPDQMQGYPTSGSEEEKDAWFERNIDQSNPVHPRQPLIEAAAGPSAILIENEFRSVKELQETVKDRLSELERWWRTREY
jgi:dCTP deaminase